MGLRPLTITLEAAAGRILIEEMEDGEAKLLTEMREAGKKGLMSDSEKGH